MQGTFVLVEGAVEVRAEGLLIIVVASRYRVESGETLELHLLTPIKEMLLNLPEDVIWTCLCHFLDGTTCTDHRW